MWLPSFSDVNVGLAEHGTKPVLSRLHSAVLPPSLEASVNAADVAFVGFGGADVIVVSGAVASTVQVTEVAGPVFPAVSVAVTESVWLPSVRPVSVTHEEGLPSRVQVSVAPGSVEIESVTLVPVVEAAAGVVTVGAAGAIVSITMWLPTLREFAAPGVASVSVASLPARSRIVPPFSPSEPVAA